MPADSGRINSEESIGHGRAIWENGLALFA
jgi:hypothetical protein